MGGDIVTLSVSSQRIPRTKVYMQKPISIVAIVVVLSAFLPSCEFPSSGANIDTPTITGTSAGSYNTNQTFAIQGNPGATMEYSLDNGVTWNTYSAEVTLSEDGTYKITCRQTDASGNTSSKTQVIVLTIDRISRDPPTITGIAAGSVNENQFFTLSGEIGALIEYSLDYGASWHIYTGEVTLSAENTYGILCRQTDVAGNQSPISEILILTIDKT
jgi:hypothetical protein